MEFVIETEGNLKELKNLKILEKLRFPYIRMGARVVEGTGLENRQACKRLVGSNPTPSAIYSIFIK